MEVAVATSTPPDAWNDAWDLVTAVDILNEQDRRARRRR